MTAITSTASAAAKGQFKLSAFCAIASPTVCIPLPKSRTVGKSDTVDTRTYIVPTTIPGADRGRVTFLKAVQEDAPKLLAASTRDGSIFERARKIGVIMKRT